MFIYVSNLLAEEFIKIMAFIIDIELTAAKELIEEIYYLDLICRQLIHALIGRQLVHTP